MKQFDQERASYIAMFYHEMCWVTIFYSEGKRITTLEVSIKTLDILVHANMVALYLYVLYYIPDMLYLT